MARTVDCRIDNAGEWKDDTDLLGNFAGKNRQIYDDD
jgi:hypothetical protein